MRAEIQKQIRELKKEMKQRGIRITSCFNGGLDSDTLAANTRLFALKTQLLKSATDSTNG